MGNLSGGGHSQSRSLAERGEIRFQSELGRTDTNDTEKDNVVLPSVVSGTVFAGDNVRRP